MLYDCKLQLYSRNIGYFKVKYDSWVIIYHCRAYVKLTTGFTQDLIQAFSADLHHNNVSSNYKIWFYWLSRIIFNKPLGTPPRNIIFGFEFISVERFLAKLSLPQHLLPLFLFFSNNMQNKKLFNSAGFELGLSEMTTLTTWPLPPRPRTF